ncbi:MAG: DUF4105 domain-containing protein [Cellvibrionaceae bacterium]
MKFSFSVLLVVFCSVACGRAFASMGLPESTLIKLSDDPVWHLLIGFGYDKQSDIVDQGFYLDAHSNRTPLSELAATLNKFQDRASVGDNHPQCQYRGRYFWLRSKLDFSSLEIPVAACPGFSEFSDDGKLDSLSLIFATGYLGNPASYYGHMLLKLNTKNVKEAIQDRAINYGARIPDNENMLLYIIKGLLGGYGSTFSAKEFYYYMHNYLDAEQRDMWEYELNLSEFQNNLLVGHLWEMIGVTHDYYFLNRNCAYRMAELLDLVLDESVNRPERPWDAPQSILQRLSDIESSNKNAVKAIHYIPSRQSVLYQKFIQLSEGEQSLVQALIESKRIADNKDFQRLAIANKIRLLDVLIEYYRFLYSAAELHKQPAYQDVLQVRLSLPEGIPHFSVTSDREPHRGHKPSYTSLGVVTTFDGRAERQIRLRPAYYDRLDFGPGHGKNGALSMLDLSLNLSHDSLRLEELSLVSIENFGGQETGLPGDVNSAWSLYAGVKSLDNSCDKCSAFLGYAERGKTYRFGHEKGLVTFLAGGGYHGRSVDTESIFGSVRATASYRFNERFDALIDTSLRWSPESDKKLISTVLEARYAISKDSDVRVKADYRESLSMAVSLGFYW